MQYLNPIFRSQEYELTYNDSVPLIKQIVSVVNLNTYFQSFIQINKNMLQNSKGRCFSYAFYDEYVLNFTFYIYTYINYIITQYMDKVKTTRSPCVGDIRGAWE